MNKPKLELLNDNSEEAVKENQKRIKEFEKNMKDYEDYVSYIKTQRQKPVLLVSESPNENMKERQDLVYKEDYERKLKIYKQWQKDVKAFNKLQKELNAKTEEELKEDATEEANRTAEEN